MACMGNLDMEFCKVGYAFPTARQRCCHAPRFALVIVDADESLSLHTAKPTGLRARFTDIVSGVGTFYERTGCRTESDQVHYE